MSFWAVTITVSEDCVSLQSSSISVSLSPKALGFTYFHRCVVTTVALTLNPSRNGLELSGGFGRQRCLVLTFLCRVILYCSGGLGLL